MAAMSSKNECPEGESAQNTLDSIGDAVVSIDLAGRLKRFCALSTA